MSSFRNHGWSGMQKREKVEQVMVQATHSPSHPQSLILIVKENYARVWKARFWAGLKLLIKGRVMNVVRVLHTSHRFRESRVHEDRA